MKRLIILQNDYPGTGKTTLAKCFDRYLREFGVEHQMLQLVEDGGPGEDSACLDPSKLSPASFVARLDQSPITIFEVATGMGEFFGKFYQGNELDQLLYEMGFTTSVVLPVTSESDSFESVIEAAETYSDNVEYLIGHLITSSYEDDDKVWDTSYAARVMDMFEAVELHIPEVGFQTEIELRGRHQDLPAVLADMNSEDELGKDFSKWLRRVMGQVDSARQYLFGDAFRPTIQPRPKGRKTSRSR